MNLSEPFIVTTSDPTSQFPGGASWHGDLSTLAFDVESIRSHLLKLGKPAWVLKTSQGSALTSEGGIQYSSTSQPNSANLLAWVPALLP
jgi:hypothetical protein